MMLSSANSPDAASVSRSPPSSAMPPSPVSLMIERRTPERSEGSKTTPRPPPAERKRALKDEPAPADPADRAALDDHVRPAGDADGVAARVLEGQVLDA